MFSNALVLVGQASILGWNPSFPLLSPAERGTLPESPEQVPVHESRAKRDCTIKWWPTVHGKRGW